MECFLQYFTHFAVSQQSNYTFFNLHTQHNTKSINIYKINDIDVVAIVIKIFGKFRSVRTTVRMPKVDYFWVLCSILQNSKTHTLDVFDTELRTGIAMEFINDEKFNAIYSKSNENMLFAHFLYVPYNQFCIHRPVSIDKNGK